MAASWVLSSRGVIEGCLSGPCLHERSVRRTSQANATDLPDRKKDAPNDKKTPSAPSKPKQAIDSTDGVCGDLGSLVAAKHALDLLD